MKKMNKRILAMLLAIVTIVSLLPLTAFADETTDDGTTPVQPTITVNFVYQRNNAMVAAPWSAQLGEDGNLTLTTIPVPAAEGYSAPSNEVVYSVEDSAVTATFTKDTDDNITGMTLMAEALKQDVSITLFYVGEDVRYIVNHLQQNLENNDYTLIEADTVEITGAIDYIPEIEAMDYEGFYFASRSDTVDDDGVTHINFLYDREKYLVTFDANGGLNAPDPQYVKFGTTIDVSSLNTPSRGELYTFAGWYNGGQQYYQLEVTQDFELTANWNSTTEQANVTYILWGQNAEDDGYSYLDTIKGEEYKGMVGNEITFATLTCTLQDHTHDDTCDTCGEADGHKHRDICYTCLEHAEGVHSIDCYENIRFAEFTDSDSNMQNLELKGLNCDSDRTYDIADNIKWIYTFNKLSTPGTYDKFIVKKDPKYDFYYLWNEGGSNKYSCLVYYKDTSSSSYSWIDRYQFDGSEIYNIDYSTFINSVQASLICTDDYQYHTHDSTCFEFSFTYSEIKYTASNISVGKKDSLSASNFSSIFTFNDDDFNYFSEFLLKDPSSLEPGTYNSPYYTYNSHAGTSITIYSNGEIWGALGSGYGGDYTFGIYLNGVCYQGYYDSSSSLFKDNIEKIKGSSVLKSCTMGNHTHGDGNCTYGCGLHEHTVDCYDHTAHSHTSECYENVKYQYDENLWKFKESTVETVEADGTTVINAYFDRTYKTINFYWDYTVYEDGVYKNFANSDSITARWGANIGAQWLAINEKAERNYWQDTPIYGQYGRSYLELMPITDQNYYCIFGTDSDRETAYYFAKKLDGTDYEQVFAVTAFMDVGISREDIYDMKGFSFTYADVVYLISNNERKTYTAEELANSATSFSGDFNDAKFYYDRKNFDLIYHSPGTTEYATETVPYGASLLDYSIEQPEVTNDVKTRYGNDPVFLGWYQVPELAGERFDFAAHTMPDNDVPLYAKWVSGVYSVETFTDETLGAYYTYDGYTGIQSEIPVNELAVKPVDPVRDNEVFVGWAYKDEEGTEHFFTFEMPITKNYKLYPKFSANVAVDYVVHYYLADSITKVAESVNGSAQIGTTVKTAAKLGTDLFEDYQTGYYPDKISVSQVLTQDNMEIIFYYSNATTFDYTVKYVYKSLDEDGKEVVTELAEPKVVVGVTSSIVTETYKPITGYSPKQYSIQLNLSTNPDENIITFEYDKVSKIKYAVVGDSVNTVTPAEESVLNNDPAKGATATAAENYRLVGWFDNEACAGTALSTDASFVPTKDADGKYAETYYAKFVQTATVNIWHLKHDDKYVLKMETHTMDVGSSYTASADETIEGYVLQTSPFSAGGYTTGLLNSDAFVAFEFQFGTEFTLGKIQAAVIPAEGLTIGLYYKLGEEDVTITYKQVKDDETTDLGSETIKESSGTPSGKTAAAIEGYKFLGWYNEAGTQVETEAEFIPSKNSEGKYEAATYTAKYDKLVTIRYEVVGNGSLDTIEEKIGETTGEPTGSTPTIPDGYHFVGWFTDKSCETAVDSSWINGETKELTPQENAEGKYVDATYYAKFEVNTLTITKNGGIAGEQYIMRVVGSDRIINVVIGSGEPAVITAIPEGSYTIQEDAKWSWRCTASDVTVTIGEGNYNASVEVKNSVVNQLWLNAVAFKDNKFSKIN